MNFNTFPTVNTGHRKILPDGQMQCRAVTDGLQARTERTTYEVSRKDCHPETHAA